MPPLISILIPTLGPGINLQRCFHSLNQQDLGLGRDLLQILVAFSTSIPQALSDTTQVNKVEYQHWLIPQLSVAQKRNFLLSQARGQIILLLDDDCALPSSHFFHSLILLNEQLKHPSVCGGGYQTPASLSLPGKIYNEVCRIWLVANPQRLLGGNIVIFPKGHRFPQFSEHTPFGGEEVLFIKNAIELGYSIHQLPQLEVLHYAQHNWRTLWARAKSHSRYKSKLFSVNLSANLLAVLLYKIQIRSPLLITNEKIPPSTLFVRILAYCYCLLVNSIYLCHRIRFKSTLQQSAQPIDIAHSHH